MNNIFEVHKLSREYSITDKQVKVLNEIDLEIEEGKITFILGPSGAGKSTLLHIMGTLDRPTSGTVLYKGDDIHRYNDKKQSRWRNKHIGFIFQFHYLLNGFLSYENVMLPAIFLHKDYKGVKESAEKILTEFSLGSRLLHKPNELSGGEQQRVAIARALINDPDVILADEPTGNLDSKNTEYVMELFRKINSERGKTFIIITHNEDLTKYGDRTVYMKDGVIVS